MKFQEYVDKLNQLLATHPEVAEYDVVTSKDDEGNEFNPVVYAPSIGHYDADEKEFKNFEAIVINAVCVN